MLTLPIKRQWFETILAKEKTEEYREIKRYYKTRFQTAGLLNEKGIPTGNTCDILFRNGYAKTSPSFIATCTLSIKKGNPAWGAVPGIRYYTLKITNIKEK